MDENETIENIIYDEDAQVVIVDLLKADFVVPGQYYYLGIPELSTFDLHPFAVARATVKDRTRVMRFIIANTATRRKALKEDSGKPKDFKKGGNSSSATPNGAAAVVLPPGVTGPPPGSNDGKKKEPTTWTSKLFAMAKAGTMPKSYRLDGPYGVNQVNPVAYENMCMISGGTGVSPHNCMLQALSLGMGPVIGNIDEKRNILLLWVIPDRSLLQLFYKDFESFGLRIGKMAEKNIQIKVFITHSECNGVVKSDSKPLPKKMKFVKVIEGKRPNFEEELSTYQKNCEENVFSRGSYTSKHTAALYLSGPAGNLQGLAMHIHRDQQSI